MKRLSLLLILGCIFVNESIAKTYYFGPEQQVLPPANMLGDEAELSRLYTYFTKDKIIKEQGEVDWEIDRFKPLLTATMQVMQLDPNRLKINVEIKNQSGFDWYIPRFEIRSLYSERKIILIGVDGYIITSFPQLISDDYDSGGSSARPVIKQSFDLFAKFSNNSIYNLTYVINIPKKKGEKFDFKIMFQEGSIPLQLFQQYRKDNPSRLMDLTYQSNHVMASCQAINDDVENGFTCSFTDIL